MAKETAKDQRNRLIAQNKKARHDYHIVDTYEAGIVLLGTEVKSLRRAGRSWWTASSGSTTARCGCTACTSRSTPRAPGPTTRRGASASCCCTAREIDKLRAKARRQGITIVPLALYFKDGRAKVEIALAKGKKEYDKRQTLAERQANREKEQAVQRRLKGFKD